MINTILIGISLVVILITIIILYMRAKRTKNYAIDDSFNTIEKVLEAIKVEMVDILRDDLSSGLSEEEFDKRYKRRARINDALKNCVYGIDSAKILVIDLIRGFIAVKVPHSKITELLGLSEDSIPSDHIKFEILMYKYKKRYGKQALVKWIEKYNLDEERTATNASRAQDKAYYITEEDLDYSYRAENIKLNIEEQIDVLAILIFQLYKGFGIIDTLREMDIDGFNCGTSGSILTATSKIEEWTFRANKSVWVYINGKYVHLRFMDFETEEELRRIVQLLIRYDNPGPLTAKRGYIVNTMYDKSRVVALRPPAAEYWCVFVRKFTLKDVSPEALLIKPYTNRGDLAIKLIEFLIRGQTTCGITGRQGSGKTTLLSSIIRFIDDRLPIRILEMAPELYLRELYPTRNILSMQETINVSAAELQDVAKKTDAAVSIVGEVATDDVAVRMIQMGQVSSIFTLFANHANTAKDLVLSLRNSLMNAGNFNNSAIAEKQVTDIVKIDIHLSQTVDGKRYIQRITEIEQLEEGIPYPDYDRDDPQNSMNEITKEYYERSTDRIGFITHDILAYDLNTHTYKIVGRFSKQLEDRIRQNLDKDMCKQFDYFLAKEFGITEGLGINIEEINKIEEEMKLQQGINITSNVDSYVEKNSTVNDNENVYNTDSKEDTKADDDFSIGLFFGDKQEEK